MAYTIFVGTERTRINAQGGTDTWYEGRPANHEQLCTELNALAIPGIRDYAIYGRPDEVAGVYPWSDNAPAGEYRHIDEAGYEVTLSKADEGRIRATILAHKPKPESDPDADLIAAIDADPSISPRLKAALKARFGR